MDWARTLGAAQQPGNGRHGARKLRVPRTAARPGSQRNEEQRMIIDQGLKASETERCGNGMDRVERLESSIGGDGR